MKFQVKKKDNVRMLVGIVLTSVLFSVLPMLTIIMPYSVPMIAVIGFATMVNVGAIIYLALIAEAEGWRMLQLFLIVFSLVITFGFIMPHPMF